MKGAREEERGLVLEVIVVPRASRSQWCGLHGDRWKVKVCAPPVDGAANEGVCRMVADTFSVPPTQVRVLAGARGRRKTLLVEGATLADLEEQSHG